MRRAQQVEGQFGLFEEFVPGIERERWISTADSGDKVIFEGANGTFSFVGAMVMRWQKL